MTECWETFVDPINGGGRGFDWSCVCVCVCACVCVRVCVWSTASAGCISITNRAALPVINTAVLRYYKLQFITTVGTVQYANFSSMCTVGLRAICGNSNVRWRGYLPLRELMWRRDGDRELCTEPWSVG